MAPNVKTYTTLMSACTRHGQWQRALEAFHRGDVQALVATDVAARGIHVDGVLGVIHFDVPHVLAGEPHYDATPAYHVPEAGEARKPGPDGSISAVASAGLALGPAAAYRDA